jgi:hypothetical protein
MWRGYSVKSDFVRNVWSVRKAIQASSGGVGLPPRGAGFARTLAYRVNQSQ